MQLQPEYNVSRLLTGSFPNCGALLIWLSLLGCFLPGKILFSMHSCILLPFSQSKFS